MSAPRPRPSIPRRRVYAQAAVLPVLAIGILLIPGRERLHSAGPPNTGHARLACGQCHLPADGTVRQQLQANARHLAGLRATGADFVHQPVGNDACVACHNNEDDRHAAYRFNEPRFATARAELAPQMCVSCHAEHTGQRVNVEPTFCSQCHSDMEIREDPIQPSHASLAADRKWGTCLTCHDYHGNHVRETPHRFEDAANEATVIRYLRGGRRIYGDRVRFPARTERGAP